MKENWDDSVSTQVEAERLQLQADYETEKRVWLEREAQLAKSLQELEERYSDETQELQTRYESELRAQSERGNRQLEISLQEAEQNFSKVKSELQSAYEKKMREQREKGSRLESSLQEVEKKHAEEIHTMQAASQAAVLNAIEELTEQHKKDSQEHESREELNKQQLLAEKDKLFEDEKERLQIEHQAELESIAAQKRDADNASEKFQERISQLENQLTENETRWLQDFNSIKSSKTTSDMKLRSVEQERDAAKAEFFTLERQLEEQIAERGRIHYAALAACT